MTYDDDFIRLTLRPGLGVMDMPIKQLGLEWPPPPFINIAPAGILFKRTRMSEITDEQRASMTRVSRGAEYIHAEPADLHEEPAAQQ